MSSTLNPFTLTVRDETTSGEVLSSLELQMTAEHITVEDLISSRVYQEVIEYNAKAQDLPQFRGLVQPTDAEKNLNGYQMKKPKRIDPKKQTTIAIEAFRRGQILLFVDDHQVTGFKDHVTLHQGSMVVFLKLVPLVGG
jgi:hypothetical protein